MNRPNKADPRCTSKVLLFQNHYAELEDELHWTVDRLRRLCAALQYTEFELGAMIRIRICDMQNYIAKNNFPAPVELHLSLIERAFLPSNNPSLIPHG